MDSVDLDGVIYYPSEEQMKLNTYLLKTYGINYYEYRKMLDGQSGKCAICCKYVSSKRLAVDHCHKTGAVRGLLCSACNTGLGSFRDNVDYLQKAIGYLEFSRVKWGLNKNNKFPS